MNVPAPRCASCENKRCREGTDCFGGAARDEALYDAAGLGELHRAASAIEARHYCRANRIEETILFARELGVGKIGLAFCIGLEHEARLLESILARHFEVISVCCKVSGLGKKQKGIERIDPSNSGEVMCNPAGQAEAMNAAGTGLNIICGLCVGHDTIFSMVSRAPVTTLIVKDRVLAHNPAGAVYSNYIRRRLLSET